MAFLEAHNIIKDYYNHRALDNFNISVEEGAIYGLLGPNGAGKTTFIRIVNQITQPDSGEVFFNGHKLCHYDISNIGYLPEERGLYKKMKVGEQAIFFAQLKGISKNDAKSRLMDWFEKFEITEWWDKKVDELSKGMQQKIQFIITVLHEPKLLIFDEPFSGFDPINANLLKKEILNLRDNGATILFSTHNMASVEEICDSISLVNKSHVILSGTVWDVKQQFKENEFNITFKGSPDFLYSDDNPIVLADLSSSHDINSATVKMKTPMSTNDLIRFLINHIELVGINEKLPSMNDIFLTAVNDNNITNTPSK